jgi:hypothetical protein
MEKKNLHKKENLTEQFYSDFRATLFYFPWGKSENNVQDAESVGPTPQSF